MNIKIYLISTLVPLILLSIPGLQGQTISGLIAHYPLNGNANDESGNAKNGAVNGSISYVTGVDGQAARFTGQGEYIEVADNSVLNTLTNEMTINFWLKGEGGLLESIPISKRIYGGNQHFTVKIDPRTNDGILFCYSSSDPSAPYPGYAAYAFNDPNAASRLNNDQWHMVTITHLFGKEASTKLYLDGVMIDGQLIWQIGDLPAFTGDSKLWIGKQPSASPANYRGLLDDLRFYNRVLSVLDIAAIQYDTGLIAHYPLNGNANDESGNAKNGTINGSISYVTGVDGQAARFTGQGEYIGVADNSMLNMLTNEMTISFWLKGEGGLIESIPISKRIYGGNQHFTVKIDPRTNDGILFCYSSSDPSAPYPGYAAYAFNDPNAASRLNNDQWHMVTITHQFGKEASTKLYLDGGMITGRFIWQIGDLPAYTGDSKLWIGKQPSASPANYRGLLDDLRFYSRVLSSNNVFNLYSMENPEGPSMAIQVKSVRLVMSVKMGKKYQLESSQNLSTWTEVGLPFVANSTTMTQDFEVADTGRFWRITEIQ